MKFRLVAFGVVAALGLGLGAVAAQQTTPASGASSQTTPPPPPLPNANRTEGPVITPTSGAATAAPPSALPAPSTAPERPRRGRGQSTPQPAASESATPEPPQFTTLDGVWELEIQPLGKRTIYQHLHVIQKGSDLSGVWMRGKDAGGDVPYTGTFDGRLFTLTLKDAKGTTWTMSGYSDNLDNLVGLLKSSDPKDQGTPFTAQHRKKESMRGIVPGPPVPGGGGNPGGAPR